jgi:hypothetical protein
LQSLISLDTSFALAQAGELTFTAVGEIEFNAYKEWYISWGPPGTGIKVK